MAHWEHVGVQDLAEDEQSDSQGGLWYTDRVVRGRPIRDLFPEGKPCTFLIRSGSAR